MTTERVLVHAGIADSRMYRQQLETLAPARAVDLPGFGTEPLESDTVDYRQFVRDRLPPEPATLVGTSLGGAIALELALESPERVAALVLVGAGVGGAEGAGEGRPAWGEKGGALQGGGPRPARGTKPPGGGGGRGGARPGKKRRTPWGGASSTLPSKKPCVCGCPTTSTHRFALLSPTCTGRHSSSRPATTPPARKNSNRLRRRGFARLLS